MQIFSSVKFATSLLASFLGGCASHFDQMERYLYIVLYTNLVRDSATEKSATVKWYFHLGHWVCWTNNWVLLFDMVPSVGLYLTTFYSLCFCQHYTRVIFCPLWTKWKAVWTEFSWISKNNFFLTNQVRVTTSKGLNQEPSHPAKDDILMCHREFYS